MQGQIKDVSFQVFFFIDEVQEQFRKFELKVKPISRAENGFASGAGGVENCESLASKYGIGWNALIRDRRCLRMNEG